LSQAVVGWLLNTLATLEEQGVFRTWQIPKGEESGCLLSLANRDGAA
jgi:hypothetical protein